MRKLSMICIKPEMVILISRYKDLTLIFEVEITHDWPKVELEPHGFQVQSYICYS